MTGRFVADTTPFILGRATATARRRQRHRTIPRADRRDHALPPRAQRRRDPDALRRRAVPVAVPATAAPATDAPFRAAAACAIVPAQQTQQAGSSVVERGLYTARVAGSIPVPPTKAQRCRRFARAPAYWTCDSLDPLPKMVAPMPRLSTSVTSEQRRKRVRGNRAKCRSACKSPSGSRAERSNSRKQQVVLRGEQRGGGAARDADLLVDVDHMMRRGAR